MIRFTEIAFFIVVRKKKKSCKIYCAKLIQRFRLVVLFASLNRCIESHEKLKEGGLAVEVVGVVGELVLDEVEAPIGVLLHCLHQHVNGLARHHLAFFKSDEANVGAGEYYLQVIAITIFLFVVFRVLVFFNFFLNC